jgi:hypothetical protein
VSTRVIDSINSPEGDHCVDIFLREDGTYGFEEYRRDVEDQKGWFSLRRHAGEVFATQGEALARAGSTVAWMAGARARSAGA